MRVCNCVGHLTNPGGACCLDLQPAISPRITPGIERGATNLETLTEADIRRIIREELARVGKA